MHKISIITINKNNKEGLEKTIKSVINQGFKNTEYIVIDGDSEDGSQLLLEKYSANIDIIVSERDSGLYNAMNKGLAKANGEYILYLNSGDELYNDSVLENVFENITSEDFFYGNIVMLDSNSTMIELASAKEIFFSKRYQHNLPPHPAFFAKKELLLKIGGFDEQYKIIADVALIAKLCSLNLKYKFIDMPITVFDTSGLSSNKSNQDRIFSERSHFILNNFPQYYKDFRKIYTNNFFSKFYSKLKSWF